MTMKNKKIDASSKRPLTHTMEDYLEAIYDLGREKRIVRVKDIAKRLNVKMPTVTNMLKNLNKHGYVEYEKYEFLELTDLGFRVGRDIHRRHWVLKRFLTDILKIEDETADSEACIMEHAIGPETLERLTSFMEFVQGCPRTGTTWLEYFDEFRLHGRSREKCMDRMQLFSNGFVEKLKDLEAGEEDGNDIK
jgi:DtxR family Mn-dependent transcriptional regulator